MNLNKDTFSGYVLCSHPEHETLAEIFSFTEFQKSAGRDDRYEVFGSALSREDALDRLGKALGLLSMRDDFASLSKEELRTLLKKELE